MTHEFENMLYLFGCGATGREPRAENCVDIKKIREISIQQNVWPVVYSAVRKKLASAEIKIPDEIYRELELSFEANLAKTIQKNAFNKNIILKLKQAGIESCLFKGMALARLYDIPETRVSGDIDILIDIENEKKAYDVLKKLGYDVQVREKNDNHMSATHPIGGVIEVHISMMRKNWDDIMFSNKVSYEESCVLMEDGIRTLGINDGLINTATHFIKHFVAKGAGIRHLMDLLLYLKEYEKEIDHKSFNLLMEELRYKKLIDAVKTVGERYWGFEFSDYEKADDETVNAFLTDMEKGGVFGFNDEKRNESYSEFVQRRKKLTDSEFKRFSMTGLDKTIFQKILPSKEEMKRAYKVEKCYGVYLMAAHIKRWFLIAKNILTGKKEYSAYVYGKGKESSEQVKERIELFEMLNIIDSEKL